jgi:hypothetical protein
MPLLLVDALEPAEAAALRAHIASGCTRCSSYLAEADATLAYLPYALEQTAPAPAARDRLFKQISEIAPARRDIRHDIAPARRSFKMPSWIRAVIPAAVAACIVFVATVQYMLHVQHDREGVMKRELTEVQHTLTQTEQRLQSSSQIMEITYRSSRQITMEGKAQSKAFGRAVWDQQRNAWHFRAFNLEPLPKNVAYELWFETPYGRKVSTPRTFVPDEHGDAYIVVTLAKDVGPVSKAFVTDEPSVGTYQPTGTVHLSGKLE